jgi:hypothetical protein
VNYNYNNVWEWLCYGWCLGICIAMPVGVIIGKLISKHLNHKYPLQKKGEMD